MLYGWNYKRSNEKRVWGLSQKPWKRACFFQFQQLVIRNGNNLERPSPDREQEIAEIVLSRSKRSKYPVNPDCIT